MLREDVDLDQLCLPRGRGGVGLQRLTASDGVARTAGFLAAAAQTHAALQGGRDCWLLFGGAATASLEQAWEQVSAFRGEPVPLQTALSAGTLQGLQRAVSAQVIKRLPMLNACLKTWLSGRLVLGTATVTVFCIG